VTIWLVASSPEFSHHWSWGPLVASWALADVARFWFYALSAVGMHVPWLTWVRYSVFILQWPFNLCAEAAFVAAAVPHLCALNAPACGYAAVAAFFQARNLWTFAPGYRELLVARRLQLSKRVHCQQRREGDAAAATVAQTASVRRARVGCHIITSELGR